VDDTGGVVAVVVCCVSPLPAPVPPAVEPPVVEDAVVVAVEEVVPAELDSLLVVGTVTVAVVGTVKDGAPLVLVRLDVLPLPQAARVKPAANAAIRASVCERVGIDRH
jgi:hypothetical protein